MGSQQQQQLPLQASHRVVTSSSAAAVCWCMICLLRLCLIADEAPGCCFVAVDASRWLIKKKVADQSLLCVVVIQEYCSSFWWDCLCFEQFGSTQGFMHVQGFVIAAARVDHGDLAEEQYKELHKSPCRMVARAQHFPCLCCLFFREVTLRRGFF